MAAQPGGVNSVLIASWLVLDWRAGNENLLSWDRDLRHNQRKSSSRKFESNQQIIFSCGAEGNGKILSLHV